MAEESAKLRIPYIAAAQAQKHVTHNEAITLLDTLVQLSVIDKDLDTPPGSPVEGDTYIVASGGTGAWIGWDKRIARFIDGTWRSYLPGEGDGAGWLAYVIDEATIYVFTGTDWEQLFVAGGHSGVSSVNGEAGDVTLNLDDIDDVNAPAPGDGHVLTWDEGAGEWVSAAPAGGDPVTLEPEGAWDSGTAYAKLDVVSYAGSSYVSRIDSNSGNQPDDSPTEWMLLAEKGEAGAGNGNVNTTGAPVEAGNLVQYADTGGDAIEDSGFAASDFAPASHGHNSGDIADFAEAAQDAVGAILDDGGDVDFTYDDATPKVTGAVKANAVTYAKMQDVSATDRLIGRASAGAGDPEEIVCTAAGRALLDDANAAAQRVTLGLDSDAIEFVIDGGGAAITTGVKGDLLIPFACTITKATLLADQSGSIVVDVWKDSYANFPPTNADSITASAKPALSSAQKSQDSTLSGWTTSIAAGDILRFNVNSVTSVQRCTLALEVMK